MATTRHRRQGGQARFDEAARVHWHARRLWLAVLLFSGLMNPLMLTGPLFMLQVYDRVIPSNSSATLAVLFALVVFMYAMMTLLDSARIRILVRIAAQFRLRVEAPVFEARTRALTLDRNNPMALSALQDIDVVFRAISSPAMLALLDTPWAFGFFILMFFLHPLLGALALIGGVIMVAIALWGQWRTRPYLGQAQASARTADTIARLTAEDADTMTALGMDVTASKLWNARRKEALSATLAVQDRVGIDGAAARAFRMLMNSAMLGAGAWLVLQGSLSPGLIVAASIITGRTLVPIELLATQWTDMRAALAADQRLKKLVLMNAEKPLTVASADQPSGALEVQQLVITPPGGGVPLLRVQGFKIQPGRAMGVIGPSGSGKTTLARALIGSVTVAVGTMRLGDDVLPLTPPVDTRLGYLPQRIILLDGTIGQNISRFRRDVPMSAIEAAGRAAGVHNLVVSLPKGYDTVIESHAHRLSGGQTQRIGLARALFDDPLLLILDEPIANLDAEGSAALNRAVRMAKARGAVVVVMAHRPAAITECEDLLVLDNGAQVAFGPRDRVLRDMVRNRTAVVRSIAPQQGVDPRADNEAGR
ncbi:type I secretion system permease/ATPase [Pararhodobacter oceanensis]|uniref:Type I secretion system permease/ATPase n=1 Tax=Pararhodobacter oceanensis TaxID=2172121 RepID=A0A2T8HUY1_9RHOB|nr:type I secretion system permease/ATPase [Pararhodobacter oceanensis]